MLYPLFLLSGLAGVTYQVLWVRQFAQLFGSSIQSAAVVTSVFLLGLGLGSTWLGRVVDRRPHWQPFRVYAWLELGIGVWAVLVRHVPPWLSQDVARWTSYSPGPDGWLVPGPAATGVRMLVAVAVLLPPTMAMGGTLPCLVRHISQPQHAARGGVGWLYAVNTLGAAAAALAVDTWWMPQMGADRTWWLAVAGSLVAGGIALAMSSSATPPAAPDNAVAPVSTPTASQHNLLRLSLFVSGVAGLGLEIAWIRHLGASLGAYRAVFGLVLACLLAALALGAAAAGVALQKGADAWVSTAWAQAATVVLAALGLFAVEPRVVSGWVLEAGGPVTLWTEAWSTLLPAMLVVAPAGLAMGAVFPLAQAALQATRDDAGTQTGALYGANTAGNVTGSLLTGFVLVPMGVQVAMGMLLALGALAVLPLVAAVARSTTRHRAITAALGVATLAAFAFSMLPADRFMRAVFRGTVTPNTQLVAWSDGPYESVAVTRAPDGSMRLLTDGFSMSGTSVEAIRYMRAMAHFPLLLARPGAQVLVICFGVGNTLHAASIHEGLAQLDVVDLSANVLRQADHFRMTNHGVLENPRIRVLVNDGRDHLRTLPPHSLDVITLEPPPIAFSGVSSLYSRDFYQAARSRLAPDGLLAQWLPAYQVHGKDALALVRAFVEVFPGALLVHGAGRELFMLGRADGPVLLDPQEIEARLASQPAVAADLQQIGMAWPVEFLASVIAEGEVLAQATADVAPVTDNHPAAEYSRASRYTATEMPRALFDVSGFARACPSCLQQPYAAELQAQLDARAVLLQSPGYRRTAPVEEEVTLDAHTRSILERSPYMRHWLGLSTPQAAP